MCRPAGESDGGVLVIEGPDLVALGGDIIYRSVLLVALPQSFIQLFAFTIRSCRLCHSHSLATLPSRASHSSR